MKKLLILIAVLALMASGCKAATGAFHSAGLFTACIARATDVAGQYAPLAHARTYVVLGTDCTSSPLADNDGKMVAQVQLYRWIGDNNRIFCGTAEAVKYGSGSHVTASTTIDIVDPGCISAPGIRWQGRGRGMITTAEGTEIWSAWHWAEVEEQSNPPASTTQSQPTSLSDRADLVFEAAYPNVFGSPESNYMYIVVW